MARFFKLNVYNTSVDSGTTDSSFAGKLKDSTQTNFTTTVSVGDIVVAAGVVYVVTAIDSNTSLSVTGGGVPNATAYTIYAGDTYTERIFSAENVMYTSRTDAYNTVIKYNHAPASADTLTLTHLTDASGEYVVDAIDGLLAQIHSGKRAGEVISSLVPEVKVATAVLS